MKEEYSIIDIGNLQESSGMVYMDEDIVLLSSLNELPHHQNNIKVNVGVGIIIICVAGKMSVNINSRKYTIQTNDILLCAPNTELNDCMISSDFKVGIIGIKSKMLFGPMQMENDFWKKEPHLKENPVICVAKDRLELFRSYFTLLKLRGQTSQREFEKEIMLSLTRALIYEIISEVKTSSNQPDREVNQQKDVLFKRFMMLLSSTQVKPRTVAWYGEKLYVTPKYLSTVCRQVSGKTAFEWINEYIMADISRMLKNSDKSIKEIANNLGFPNIAFFGKYVKSHTGHNPTNYRKQLRESKR